MITGNHAGMVTLDVKASELGRSAAAVADVYGAPDATVIARVGGRSHTRDFTLVVWDIMDPEGAAPIGEVRRSYPRRER